jgi:hypothetical protein
MEIVGVTTTFPPAELGVRLYLADFCGVSVDQAALAGGVLRISLP